MKRCLLVALFLLAGCGTGITETTPTGVSLSAPAPGTEYNDADVMFLQMAVPQHEQGIELASLAADRATDPEVRDLAAAVTATQEDELTQMREWLTDWDQPVAPDLDPAAHTGHGGMHGSDPAVVQVLRDTPPGPDFDTRFLNLLTGHQHGAVELARLETKDGYNAEARALADRIITSRAAEIKQMGTYLER
jgi:uncharacterized protein (DUF305 family)